MNAKMKEAIEKSGLDISSRSEASRLPIHTALPWVAERNGVEMEIWADRLDGRTRHRECVAVINGLATAQAIADAEFIVKTVNAHDELVATLKAVTEMHAMKTAQGFVYRDNLNVMQRAIDILARIKE